MLLAGAPWVPTLIGVGIAFRGMSSQKATGLGAIAGGFAEALIVCGIGAIVITQAAAIVFLWRTFSKEHRMRGLFSVVSICASSAMLFVVGLFLWWSWFWTHNAF